MNKSEENYMHTLTDDEYKKLVKATFHIARAQRFIGDGNGHSKEQMEAAIELLDDIIWRLGIDEEKFNELA